MGTSVLLSVDASVGVPDMQSGTALEAVVLAANGVDAKAVYCSVVLVSGRRVVNSDGQLTKQSTETRFNYEFQLNF